MRSFLIALSIAVVLWAGLAGAQEGVDLIENVGQGQINWSRGFVQASGMHFPENCSTSGPIAKIDAIQMARAKASAKVLETVMTLRIDAGTRVSDFVAASGVYLAKIKELINTAEELQHISPLNGSVEVTLRMGIYGSFAQLVLPREIKQVESIRPMTPIQKPSQPAAGSVPAQPAPDGSAYAGLIVDARGIGASSALVPVILDERGHEVFGSAFVSREFAVQHGLSGYTRSMQVAQGDGRIGGNSLIVKGLRVHPSGCCNIVISNADAAKIRSTYAHLTFLKQCRVMIVLD
jgi:hypothetical protein